MPRCYENALRPPHKVSSCSLHQFMSRFKAVPHFYAWTFKDRLSCLSFLFLSVATGCSAADRMKSSPSRLTFVYILPPQVMWEIFPPFFISLLTPTLLLPSSLGNFVWGLVCPDTVEDSIQQQPDYVVLILYAHKCVFDIYWTSSL